MHIFNFGEFKKEKKKKKIKVGVLFRILTCFFVILFLLLSPAFLFNRKIYKQDVNNFFANETKTTILSLIHVETFEGAVSSREKFLERQATLFNKENKGVYITIKTLTPEQFRENFKEGFCDIVSFGFGVGEIIKEHLLELQKVNLRDEFLKTGENNGKLVAYPYSFGGYAAITKEKFLKGNTEVVFEDIGSIKIKDKNKKEYSFGFAKDTATNIAEVLSVNNIKTSNNLFYENNLSTYKMYENFLGEKFATLIGTTRDVVRCKDREMKGSLSPCVYNFLGGFTDLVQYMGITTKHFLKEVVARKFLNFIMENKAQQSLNKVGLFSPVCNEIYSDGYLKDFEKVLSKELTIPNAFLSTNDIDNMKKESFKKVVYVV